MPIEWTWILTVLSLAGVILNIRKDSRCFAIWIVTNSGWAIYDAIIGAYAQGCVVRDLPPVVDLGDLQVERGRKAH